jgi:hypothetical protein
MNPIDPTNPKPWHNPEQEQPRTDTGAGGAEGAVVDGGSAMAEGVGAAAEGAGALAEGIAEGVGAVAEGIGQGLGAVAEGAGGCLEGCGGCSLAILVMLFVTAQAAFAMLK